MPISLRLSARMRQVSPSQLLHRLGKRARAYGRECPLSTEAAPTGRRRPLENQRGNSDGRPKATPPSAPKPTPRSGVLQPHPRPQQRGRSVSATEGGAEAEALRRQAEKLPTSATPAQVEEMLQAMRELRGRGFLLPARTAHALLVACRRADNFEAGMQVFEACRGDGYQVVAGEYNGLITSAFNAERYDEALQLFERMQSEGVVPDIVTYNKVANVHLARADVGAARALIEHMERAGGVAPDVYIHGCLLGALALNRQLPEAFEHLGQLQRSGKPEFLTSNPYRILMMQLSNMGDWLGCLEVWADMKARNIMPDRDVFKNLIYSLSITNTKVLHRRRILELTDEYALMKEGRVSALPSQLKPATLRTIMVAAWEEGDKKRAAAAAAELVQIKDKLSGNVLRVALMAALDMGNDHLAQAIGKVVKVGDKPQLALDNLVLSALSGLRRWDDFDRHYARMKEKDAQTYRSATMAAVSRGLVQEGLAVLEEAVAAGQFDEKGLASLIIMFQKKGQAEACRRAIDVAEGRMGGTIPLWVYERAAEAFSVAGDWQGAEDMLRRVQRAGMAPSTKLYNMLLYACAQAGEVRKAADFLNEMETIGVEANSFNHNTLLLAHAKSGDWKGAFSALRGMSRRGIKADLVSFNTVIKAAAASGHWGFTNKILNLMEAEGVEPDIITYNSCLVAVKNAGSWWGQGEDLLSQIRSRGLSPNTFTYNVMLEVYASAGKLDACLRLMKQMRTEGLVLDAYTYFAPLRVAVQQRRWADAIQLQEQLAADGVDLRPRNTDMIVATLLGTDRRPEAEKLVEDLRAKQGATSSTLVHEVWLGGLIYAGCGPEALEYARGVVAELPASSFGAAFNICRRVGDMETGRGLSSLMREAQVQLDVGSLTALAAMYSHFELWDEGIATLEQARAQNWPLVLNTYKSWLHCLHAKRDGPGVLRVLDDMRANGLQDVETYAHAMRTLLDVGDMAGCEEVMRRFNTARLPPSSYFAQMALRHAVKRGGLSKCVATLRKLKVDGWPLGVSAYNTVLVAAGDDDDWGRVISTFDSMRVANVKPDSLSFSLLINAYGRMGNLRAAIDAFNQMLREGQSPLPVTYNYLMMACGRADRYDLAAAYFDEMQAKGLGPNLQAYNSLISAAAKSEGIEEAEKLLPLMRARGFAPDTWSYNPLLDACGRRGNSEKAAELLHDMQRHGLRPDLASYLSSMLAWTDSSWPSVMYLYEEGLRCVGEDLQSRNDLLRTMLEYLQRDPVVFELVGRRAYQQAVADRWVGHWGCEANNTFKMVDFHEYSRAMARCALADVLDEAVAGRGPLEEDRDPLKVICGQNAGRPTLMPDVVSFLQQLEPPLEALVSSLNAGRLYIDRVIFWRWVKARRKMQRDSGKGDDR